MIFGINTTGDISNCYTQFCNILSGIYAKYHEQIMLLFVYTTPRKSFVILTCRYFKLSRNTTALSQSNCRNFSCSRIKIVQDNERIYFEFRINANVTKMGRLPYPDMLVEHQTIDRWLHRLAFEVPQADNPHCI